MSDNPEHLKTLVAHYLSTHYPTLLPSYLDASGAAPPSPTSPPVPDLRTLVCDAQSSQLAEQLSRTRLDAAPTSGVASIVAQPLPAEDTLSRVERAFDDITDANLLAVVVGDIPRRRLNTATAQYEASKVKSVVCAGADKHVRVLDWATGEVSLSCTGHSFQRSITRLPDGWRNYRSESSSG